MAHAGSLASSSNGTEIQVLSIEINVLKLTATGTSSRGTLPSGATPGRLIRLASVEHIYIKFGDNTVIAALTDTLYPAGVEVMQVPTDATDIAVLQVADTGPVTVTALS